MSVARTARLLEATALAPFAPSRPIGQQLVDALRDAHAAGGDDLLYFPGYAVGYLEGLLNDIAGQVPGARKLIQYHIDANRAKAIGPAA